VNLIVRLAPMLLLDTFEIWIRSILLPYGHILHFVYKANLL